MPVEIREIVIKTVIHTKDLNRKTNHSEVKLEALKLELLAACKQLIHDNVKRGSYQR